MENAYILQVQQPSTPALTLPCQQRHDIPELLYVQATSSKDSSAGTAGIARVTLISNPCTPWLQHLRLQGSRLYVATGSHG